MENKEISTIKLRKQTKARLDRLKVYRRETYDEILEKMLNILNIIRFNPEQARSRLVAIDKQKRRNTIQSRPTREIKEIRKEKIPIKLPLKLSIKDLKKE